MFGIIADLIASVTTILLPAYLSYKSLRTHDPAQTHPWLIYFTILSLSLLFESWVLFIIGWMPFYSWFRLFFLLYLVLPQTQGAKVLYLNYLEPYIVQHETRIDHFISETHDQLQQMGLGYINIAIEYIREKVLGQKSPQPSSQQQAGATGYASYAQDLLARFAMPSARIGAPTQAAAGNTMYSTLTGLAGAAIPTGWSSRDINTSATVEAGSIPDSLVSDSLRGTHGTAEKSQLLSLQRERLTTIIKALDKEQQNLDLAYGSSTSRPRRPSSSHSGGVGTGLKTKSKSEQSFDKIDYDEADSHDHTPAGYSSNDTTPPRVFSAGSHRSTSSGNWIPTGVSGWFGGNDNNNVNISTKKKRNETDESTNYSSRTTSGGSGGGGGGGGGTKTSKGWSAARDITEAMSQGMSSGVDNRR